MPTATDGSENLFKNGGCRQVTAFSFSMTVRQWGTHEGLAKVASCSVALSALWRKYGSVFSAVGMVSDEHEDLGWPGRYTSGSRSDRRSGPPVPSAPGRITSRPPASYPSENDGQPAFLARRPINAGNAQSSLRNKALSLSQRSSHQVRIAANAHG